ncbi:MAG: glycosyltransferase family 2 protein, partial [Gammaproteobacteria bacterium]
RRSRFQGVCAELGVHYLSRSKNINAKAGNLNAALKHLSGDLLLVLDADHAPTVDILMKTVGAFVQDEDLFLVQTPHFFINPDPIEKNLNLFYRMPAENFMFYNAIQSGLDFWQASFFCGSAAVLRRKAIDEVGGFSGVTITEDSETALKLHSKGWKSHYLMYPLISGLQPETFSSFMVQRTRWAQGMVQNFILHNPLLLPKLRIWQRICYLSNMMFWFFPFARFIFLVSPGLYLFFGLKIYNANSYEFFGYTVPYLIALLLTNHYLFSQVRWVFVSEIYETMQSLFSIKAVMAVLKNPHHPRFSVTPKVEMMERDFISPLAGPFYWTLCLTISAAGFGVWRFFSYPDERALIAITVFWALFNLLLLLAALGALYEQKQRRVNPRIPVNIDALWLVGSPDKGLRLPVTIKDISMGGGSIVSELPLPSKVAGGQSFLEISAPAGSVTSCYQAAITNTLQREGRYIYGIKFIYSTLDEYLNIVKFVHGDSSRWAKIQQDSANDPGLIKSMAFMVNIGIYYGISHIKIALSSLLKK